MNNEPNTHQEDELLTPSQVGERLKKDVKTLRRWRYEGFGPPYQKLNHKTVLYPRSELEAWIQEQANELRVKAS